MRIVTVQLGGKSYSIVIGQNARAELNAELRRLVDDRRVIVIADQSVADLHLDRLRAAVDNELLVLTLPTGETSKSLDQASRFYDEFSARRVERGDVVLTFGGGVAGDLGGFVAGTWLRGLRFVQIPTTLEAAIDASVGGKTAVNHASGKNLIGVFHQPSAIFVDTDFLETLPQREFSAGLAESVKHALISDPSFLDWQIANAAAILQHDPDALVELIARNCEIKARVVAEDEREANLRMILNFGHTVGHAIEHLAEYELRHGEAIALGMLVSAELSRRLLGLETDTLRRMRDLIELYGLPLRLQHPLSDTAILETCRMDKKARGGAVRFVLLRALGEPVVVDSIEDDELRGALAVIR